MDNRNNYNNAFIGIPHKGVFKNYQSNIVFNTIEELCEFYEYFSTNDNTTTIMVAKGPINFNNAIILSLSNTLDSIQRLLKLGRINDAFSLIRKYNDAIITHIYALIASEKEENLFFNEDYSAYNNIVNRWVNGKQRIIEKGESESIEKRYLSEIKNRDPKLFNILFNKKKQKLYGQHRSIGDDNLHYNNWNSFRFNNQQIMDYPISLDLLSDANETIKLLFVIHFSYLILLKPMAMLSCDYIDELDDGNNPDEAAKDNAAPIICDLYGKYIDIYDKNLSEYLCKCTFLKLRY